ncbi:MAG: RDD family protein [Actinomycetota bacterium]
MSQGQTPAGWYHAEGDPPGTNRYWDGTTWVGDPQPSNPQAAAPPQAAVPPPTDPYGAPPMGAPAGAGGFGPAPDWGVAAGSVAAPRLTTPGARIGGRLLDYLVWFFLWLIAHLPTISETFSEAFEAALNEEDPPPVDISTTSIVLSGLATIFLVVAYEVFMNVRVNGTFGKKVTSSKIVSTDGSDLTMSVAVRRMVPYIGLHLLGLLIAAAASGADSDYTIILLGLGGLVGLIMLFADSRHQTLWDKLAGTLVVVR